MLLFDKDGRCSELPEPVTQSANANYQPVIQQSERDTRTPAYGGGINESSSSSASTPRAGTISSVVDNLDAKPVHVQDQAARYHFVLMQQQIRVKKTLSIQDVKDKMCRGLQAALGTLNAKLETLNEHGRIDFRIDPSVLENAKESPLQ